MHGRILINPAVTEIQRQVKTPRVKKDTPKNDKRAKNDKERQPDVVTDEGNTSGGTAQCHEVPGLESAWGSFYTNLKVQRKETQPTQTTR
eukprot:1772066-Karenia_brevis.AAC.1